jgi:alkyldihydroxyacetonephosphate synthase
MSDSDSRQEPTASRLIFPGPPPSSNHDQEQADGWGFADSGFEINANEMVEMTGARYSLSGSGLPNLLPWIHQAIGIPVDPQDVNRSQYPPQISEPARHPDFLSELRKFLDEDAISDAPDTRLRHGHGHSQDEIFSIRYAQLGRIPDLVVYPAHAEQTQQLVSAALKHDVCLIPYGGGTNVSHALLCPDDETRLIVSVDMCKMNRITWIDPHNQMAEIQAGAVGRHISQQLAEYGFTMGHEPDSIEFSTLGGWIATHASGMKKNRYGNIEDLVLNLSAVTADGLLERKNTAPRESIGIDHRHWIYGSEGTLGIITSAIIKIFPLPEVQRYGSVIFKSFGEGFKFLYELKRSATPPASVRLVDNQQFHFGRALKPASIGSGKLKRWLEGIYITRVRGFNPEEMAACTLLFEGSRKEVETQQAELFRIARKHGGLDAGEENGRRGYELTFAIAYIRDFVMSHYLLAESFETSVSWSDALELCERVKRRVQEEHAARDLPGKPFVSCRITQLYETGVCVYFYFAYHYKGVANPSAVYAEIERAARDEVLRSGGSLSHHHGVGKLRQRFLPEVLSDSSLTWSRKIKSALDPMNIFGSSNQESQSKDPSEKDGS